MDLQKEKTSSSLLSSSLFPTLNGLKLACDLTQDDYLFGLDGKPIKVLCVNSLDLQDIYCVEFSDGRKVYCGIDQSFSCIEHQYPNDPSTWNDINTEVLSSYSVEELMKKTKQTEYNRNPICVPLCNPVEYSSKKYTLFPQSFGMIYFLSSQSYVEKTIRIVPGFHPTLCQGKGYVIGFNLTAKKKAPIFEVIKSVSKEPATLKDLGIEDTGDYKDSLCKEFEKNYIYGAIGQRFVLIQGIMDCIGGVDMLGVFHTQILYNPYFIKPFLSLLHSMGIPLTVTTIRQPDNGNKEGVIINIYTTLNNIGRLFGQKSVYAVLHRGAYLKPLYQFQTPCTQIKCITKENIKSDMVNIRVDNPDNIFLGTDYITLG